MAFAQKFLSKTLGQLNGVDYLSRYPHRCAPCHNTHRNLPEDFLTTDDKLGATCDLFKNQVKFTHPVPVFHPVNISREEINGVDPAFKLANQKRIWNLKKKRILSLCEDSMIPVHADENEEEMDFSDNENIPSSITCHPNLYALVDHMEKDPDPYLDGVYDWYYTGGNIGTLLINDNTYLIRSAQKKKKIINILLYRLTEDFGTGELNNELDYTFLTNNQSDIFQIDTYKNIALIRQKNNCTYVTFNEVDDGIVQDVEINIDGENPFISSSINNKIVGEFCTLSPDQELTIWKSQEGKMTTDSLNCKGMNVTDCWGQVYYIDANTVAYMDRSTVNFVDLRTHIYGRSSNTFDISNITEECDKIFCGTQGSFGLHYITTGHNLLSLDPRIGWIQKWTHGISTSPCLISTTRERFKEMIVVGCQRSDNVAYMENHFQDDGCFSPLHPYILPSRAESLNKARCENLCLDYLINSRFRFITTGLCCYENRGIHILRSNSVGDVFWQKRVDATNSDDENFKPSEIKLLNQWENECVTLFKQSQTPVSIKRQATSKHLLQRIYEERKPAMRRNMDINSSEYEFWQKSKKSLLQYCDYLVPTLLQIWDIENEPEWCSKEPSDIEPLTSSDEEEDIAERVAKWFETYEEDIKGCLDIHDEKKDFSENEQNESCRNIDNSKIDSLFPSFTDVKNIVCNDSVDFKHDVSHKQHSDIAKSFPRIENVPRESLQSTSKILKDKFVPGF
ncbi:uncharacterized protein LOC106663375 [Cimex lectularius]|uniref:Uncharacterized protein n=1 Tax=Cimex lectularius TaxID=79782 RepID=A0A8I6RF67_CIMLE|nr:uncharacterized protein LOC106663375 [Cimex lectularius]